MSEAGNYLLIAILLLGVAALALVIMLLTHGIDRLLGTARHGRVKDSTYESGVDPIKDARQRFNVKFYLVAVLFLVFDVEIIFLYPWAVIYSQLNDPSGAAPAWAAPLASAGYGPGFFLISIGIFFGLLTIGFLYEWRKGVFRWD